MTGIPAYSTTASENIQANTGINWDEGMSPAAVNNSARQNMADTRAALNDAIWFEYGVGSKTVAAVYASGTSFTLAGTDATTAWHAGRRVKATGASTGTIYGTVSSSAFATATTTVNATWDSGSLSNESLHVYLCQIPVTGVSTGTGRAVLQNAPGIVSGIFSGTSLFNSATSDPTFNRSNGTVVTTGGAVLSRTTNGCDNGLDSTSGTNITFYTDNGSRVTAGSISSSGSTTAYNTSSDISLKTNIQDAPDAGLVIDGLRVRSWDWKSDGAHEKWGFVAQEEYEFAPFAVTPGSAGKPWGRDDSKLVPLLVKEIQSLRVRVAALEAK